MSEPISPAAEKAQTVFVQEAVEAAGEVNNAQSENGYTQKGVEMCSRMFRYESSNGPSIVYVARNRQQALGIRQQ